MTKYILLYIILYFITCGCFNQTRNPVSVPTPAEPDSMLKMWEWYSRWDSNPIEWVKTNYYDSSGKFLRDTCNGNYKSGKPYLKPPPFEPRVEYDYPQQGLIVLSFWPDSNKCYETSCDTETCYYDTTLMYAEYNQYDYLIKNTTIFIKRTEGVDTVTTNKHIDTYIFTYW